MTQKNRVGERSVSYTNALLKKLQPKNILLVTGKKSYETSRAKRLLTQQLAGYKVTRFSDFSTSPKVSDVKKGIRRFKKSGIDVVIAVGGGSVIDMAKSFAVLSQQVGTAKDYVLGKKIIKNKGIPLIAIPTTAGSGSEATQFAVVYIGKTKYSLDSPYMLPSHAIVDPQFTYDLPASITATSGMDAFCQAVESYWSTRSSDTSKIYAKKAIKIILKNLETAVNNPTKKTRLSMSIASHLAGQAINISRTTACHAASYPITSFFKVPHGHAVALTLSSMLGYNAKVSENDLNDKRGLAYVKTTLQEINKLIGATSTRGAKQKINDLLDSVHLSRSLKSLGLKRKDIEIIVENGFNPQRVKNNPRQLTKESLRKILVSLY